MGKAGEDGHFGPITTLEQRINKLEDWIKADIQECLSLLSGNPRSCVIAAGVFTEDIVKKLCPKNWDLRTRYPNNGHPKKWDPKKRGPWSGSTANFITYLGDNYMVPEEIITSMNTVRIFRNQVMNGEEGIDKTQVLDTLNAALNVAEWHMATLRTEKGVKNILSRR